jgi:hypothetical protein
MKTFNELTPAQQEEAILRTEVTLRDLVAQKVILADRPMTEESIREVAEAAAETAFYTESGDMVIEGVA